MHCQSVHLCMYMCCMYTGYHMLYVLGIMIPVGVCVSSEARREGEQRGGSKVLFEKFHSSRSDRAGLGARERAGFMLCERARSGSAARALSLYLYLLKYE